MLVKHIRSVMAMAHWTRYLVWGIRLLILWVVCSALVAPRPRAMLDAPQTVVTLQPQVCVHTRLIDEVEEWVIQRSLQLVREMGADTIVEFFPWAYIESTPGVYDWSQADKIVRHAQNQGIRIIARMGFVPQWARPDEPDFSTLNYLTDDHYDDFAHFVVTFAARYAGVIDHIIIWNEPNLAFEWGYRPPNPLDYLALLQAVYAPVHQANPDIIVLAGALAPTLEPVGSPHGMMDTAYLEQLYAAGAATYFDALAIHTYGFTQSSLDPPMAQRLNFRRAELLYDIMVRYGDDATPVYITESGWNDHPRWIQAVHPSERVQYTIDALQYAETHWQHVEKLCLWVFRYPVPTLSYPDNYALVTTDFQTLPIYDAIKAYATGQQQNERPLWLPPPHE